MHQELGSVPSQHIDAAICGLVAKISNFSDDHFDANWMHLTEPEIEALTIALIQHGLKAQAECCPLACSVSPYALYGDPWGKNRKTGQSVRRSDYHHQSSDLANLRRDRPWYQQIHRCVLVEMLRQVDRAFQNFFTDQKKPPKQRQGFGYPQLK